MFAIGIDIGGTSMKGGLVNENGEVIDTFTVITKMGDDASTTINNLIDGINEFIRNKQINKLDIKGIGMGVPGAINSTTGVVDYSNNLAWRNVPIKEMVEKRTGLSVIITNDANAATLGEARFGFKWKYKNVVMLTLGTGVGGGLVINGELYEGREGKGAELGHALLVMDGELCTCGRKGCVEAYASASALKKQTRAAMLNNRASLLWELAENNIENANGRLPFIASKMGDKTAKTVIDNYIKYLGEAIITYCNIFRPNAIILSGGIAKQGKYLINRLNTYCSKHHWGFDNCPIPELLIATLGYQSGIIGAASLFL